MRSHTRMTFLLLLRSQSQIEKALNEDVAQEAISKY